MSDLYNRRPLSDGEFYTLQERLAELLRPLGWVVTSTDRNEGSGSRHDIDTPGRAVDWGHPHRFDSDDERAEQAVEYAKTLGLYAVYHDAGSGWHLHTQSVPAGWEAPDEPGGWFYRKG